MTKNELLRIVQQDHESQEAWYLDEGPNKHTQEEHYQDGVSVVRMNVGLLTDWLDWKHKVNLSEFSKADRREIWEASQFHYGITGYEKRDADFWWNSQVE